MDVQLHAPHALLEILHIPLHLGTTGQLISGQIGIMGAKTIIMMQWMPLLKLLLPLLLPHNNIPIGEHPSTKMKKRYLLAPTHKQRIRDIQPLHCTLHLLLLFEKHMKVLLFHNVCEHVLVFVELGF